MRKTTVAYPAGLVLILVAVGLAGRGHLSVEAQQPNRAALIVDFGDRHITECVEFTEPEISGYDVLRRAGLDVVIDASNPMGIIVCDINDTSGCAPSDCFCECQGSPCVYWAYHYLENGSWRYSQLGASDRKVRNGDVEGWGWGEGRINSSGQEPPLIPFDQICAPAATSTPSPTDTPVPPTATSLPPTDTPSPTSTPAPTAVPEPEVWFRLDQNPIPTGSCTTLRWDTSNVQEVLLDGDAVSTIGSRQVCPAAATDYELSVVGLDDDREVYQLTLGVTGSAAPQTATPQPAAIVPDPSPSLDEDSEAMPTSTSDSRSTPEVSGSATVAASSGASGLSEAQPATSMPSTPTRAEFSQEQPAATPIQIAESRDPEAPEMSSAETSSDGRGKSQQDAPSPFLPIGYITFSLIVGGLLGWLIYVIRFRRPRA